MRDQPFSDGAIEALLSGTMTPEDAPPGLREVARIVKAARRADGPLEPAGEERMIADLASNVRRARSLYEAGSRRSVRSRRWRRLISIRTTSASLTLLAWIFHPGRLKWP